MNMNATLGTNQGILDIHLVQGDHQEVVLEVRNDAGAPVSMVGYTIRMQARVERNASSPVVLEKSIGNGISVSAHVITLTFGAETNALKGCAYPYDILLIQDGKHQHFISGKILIKKSVTV